MKTKQEKRIQIILHVILCLMILLWLYPIIFAVCNSFKTSQEALNHVISLIPLAPTIDNYVHVFETLPFVRITLNTLFIAVTVTSIKLLTSFMAAYALVYFDVKGKGILYFLMLSTMFIPFTVSMIPNYLLISKWKLADTVFGVILPQLADVLGIFMLRQAMRGIPKSIIEVARLDRISHKKTMKEIVLPIVKPSLCSTGIIFFINSWNEYVWPVLILKSKENYTLSLALQMFISAEGGTNFPVAMAVSVMTMSIPLVLYLFFQRQIIDTFAMSGIKG
ncbi:MAG: carbohydrate ABC transporter permease [Lachnospiraceae bacterium]|nr:carbohydrate ABC transporter permease [Lachnospiraceae bacterium]